MNPRALQVSPGLMGGEGGDAAGKRKLLAEAEQLVRVLQQQVDQFQKESEFCDLDEIINTRRKCTDLHSFDNHSPRSHQLPREAVNV